MRVLPFLATVALVLLAAPAAAQDPDGPPGCVEANPCDVILAVDADGFADVSAEEFAAGDWIVITLVNHDEAEHTISLAGHDFEIVIAAGDIEDAQPLRIGSPGTYALVDQPSGDTVQWTSVPPEEFGESTMDDKDNGIPGPGVVLVLAAVAALALALRRTA